MPLWDKVSSFRARDEAYKRLCRSVISGGGALEGEFEDMRPCRGALEVWDGEVCVLRTSRVVVPEGLRSIVLEDLHRGHRDAAQMGMEANLSVFWPGIEADIDMTFSGCSDCQEKRYLVENCL